LFLHKIRVIAKGIKEFVSHTKNIEKLYLAYHLKDILEKGEEQEKQSLKHDRKDGIKYFIPLKTQVKIDGKNRLVRSFIAVDKNGNMFYDMFINIPAKLNDPEKESGSNKASNDESLQQTNNSVNQVLNLFIDGETESKNNNSKLPLTYYDYFRLVYLKSHDYKEFLRQVDKYEVKVKNQDFKEAEHPRDEEGRFSEKEEGTKEERQDFQEEQAKKEEYYQRIYKLLGKEFKNYKGKSAIDKLMIEKSGHIKDAFYRKEIGNITIFGVMRMLDLLILSKEENEKNKT